MKDLHIRAEELRPEHLGHDIIVPVGLEREGLYLTKIAFYADRDNTGSGFRVLVVDANPTRVFDLASYAKVEVVGWDGPEDSRPTTEDLQPGDVVRYGEHRLVVESVTEKANLNHRGDWLSRVLVTEGDRGRHLYALPEDRWEAVASD
jgi:hypothetical protein